MLSPSTHRNTVKKTLTDKLVKIYKPKDEPIYGIKENSRYLPSTFWRSGGEAKGELKLPSDLYLNDGGQSRNIQKVLLGKSGGDH